MKKKNRQYLNVPNLFTAVNLFSGFLSVLMTLGGNYVAAAWLIIMAAFFDAMDGRIARMTGVSSEFGLQMDSLSDVVSAGVAPSVLVYQFHFRQLGSHVALGIMVSFLPLLFASFRLARYNVVSMSEGHSSDYMGLPAPTAASTISAVVLLYIQSGWPFLLRLLVILVPIVSIAMASEIRYEGLPSFNLREKGKNRLKLIVIMITLVGVAIKTELTMFIFAMLFLLSGPCAAIWKVFRTPRERAAKE
ncbi:MAG: CDP-diacylglycerol--serine O-phosphatidyltransferase [candidate division KSB1 bacterium]|nr:CDP-diacylglycerol--serine O-phosphatidyltransferase [candidate division KSB1 bacterium]MDZ7345528.1 CDP-diacylglycerol--serine O-phosphatidyltransferase [candidate division KSB1 bacterium]